MQNLIHCLKTVFLLNSTWIGSQHSRHMQCPVLCVSSKLTFQQALDTYIDQPPYHLFPLLACDLTLYGCLMAYNPISLSHLEDQLHIFWEIRIPSFKCATLIPRKYFNFASSFILNSLARYHLRYSLSFGSYFCHNYIIHIY